MSVVAARTPAVGQTSVGVWPIAQSAAVVSVGLYAVAFIVRLWATSLIHFPLNEGSAYYAAVSQNLAAGRGLVIDSIWSYATAPLTLPRPAFELWQPLASFVYAAPMTVLGQTFSAAQLGAALLGALVAPLAWLVARDTASRLAVPERRAWFVAVGAGVLVAVAGPMLLTAVVPDSYVAFTVIAVAACLVMPRAAAGSRSALVGLGVLLGLAYLTRMEAVWLGLTFLVLVAVNRPGWRSIVGRVGAVAIVGALVASPWWLRNISVFGSPFPGQIADNVFLTTNEQIYSYLDQPTLEGFLAQGVGQIAANVGLASWHNFVDVLLVPVTAITAFGFIAVAIGVARQRALPDVARRGSLAALLISGALTFVLTSVAFPVATLWGTFEHASGPLLVGLTVAALIGGDAFVAWLVKRRDWQRQNAWLAPTALLALTVPIALFQLVAASRQAAADERTVAAISASVPSALAAAGVDAGAPVITDRPIWLSDALRRSTLALPAEPASTVLELAKRFGAQSVVVVEGRGTYPAALHAQPDCFTALDSTAADGASVFVITRECMR